MRPMANEVIFIAQRVAHLRATHSQKCPLAYGKVAAEPHRLSSSAEAQNVKESRAASKTCACRIYPPETCICSSNVLPCQLISGALCYLLSS